jgi:transglutaminase superfamily protein
MSAGTSPMGTREKAVLVGRVYLCFASTYLQARRHPLPELMEALLDAKPTGVPPLDPKRLGRIVQRLLRLGPWRARCLWTALVLYRLLRGQGDAPQLVIGLPREPKDKDAHAWVEIDGLDVGPPPGRSFHEELARYG